MNAPNTLAKRLAVLRKAKRPKVLQVEVAVAVGISRPALSNIENGHDEPGRETLVKLADYFGVSLDYLEKGAAASGNDLVGKPIKDREEGALIRLWRALEESQRRTLVEVAVNMVRGNSGNQSHVSDLLK